MSQTQGRVVIAWLRRLAETEEDKGNLWIAGVLTRLADWMDGL